MKLYLDAIHKATDDMAEHMSGQLRLAAIKDGWEPEVANGLSISVQNGEPHYSLGTTHKDRAFVHEFGNETQRPKATVRKFLNNSTDATAVFAASAIKHSKGK